MSYLPQPTQQEVEERYTVTQEIRRRNQRQDIAKTNACIARQMAQNFGEHQTRLETIANLGSDVEQAVALHLANYCNKKRDEYREQHRFYMVQAEA